MTTAYRQRSSSPFRQFHKPKSVDGLSNFLAPSSTQNQYYSVSNNPAPEHHYSVSTINPRSLSMSPAAATAPASTFKFKFGSPSLQCRSPNGFPNGRLPSDAEVQQQGERESVLVTVRFRPLSLREIHRGDEIAWFADGDTVVRSEYNPATAYAFDRVFGPATTTRAVYDVAARQVVRGAMEGINGTVFAYGVTSSGKTHTMHGDHRSPGIIPLAVKDVFSIIQDTPGREYLLRVSYLEIYNEVINDLLDPAGQNLRIREDAQGTYVEGVKEEVVLSPAHALSLITAGEEHRHVGSNNFNLLSSRSHTIFTLTIESSSHSGDKYDDEIMLSQLNLIDLAGSESSKTETTGLRRKEGSYINKSLLTLGTVISKLSEGKASHVPYRDSKLTRLLQSSLSGHGRVSLICTLTPASSNIEETHNTLKFAHRAKRVAIHAASNRIMDEKSLIKKYQKEILCLKQELDQLRRGIFDKTSAYGTTPEDLLSLRQQLEAGQVKLQSRLEEEEQAKAALLGRIQRLTKLILVSTKNSTSSQESGHPILRRRHSFGEEDLKSFRAKRRAALDWDDESSLAAHEIEHSAEGKTELNGAEEGLKDKKSKRRGMLGWFKLRKYGSFGSTMNLDIDSPSISISATPAQTESGTEVKGRQRSFGRKSEDFTPVVKPLIQFTQAGELFSATGNGRKLPPTGETMADQMDLLREQAKMLAAEVAFCTSSLKRFSEQAVCNPDDAQLQTQMEKMKEEIKEKRQQIEVLEQRIVEASQAALNNASPFEMSETIAKLMTLLNEKEFELELKTADNRILQDQLQSKISEVKELQETITSIQQQITPAADMKLHEQNSPGGYPQSYCINGHMIGVPSDFEHEGHKGYGHDSGVLTNSHNFVPDAVIQNKMLVQAAEMERLKQENVDLMEENGGLKVQSQKLAEEAAYAKELASAAAVELKILAEEVKKLSSQNSQLTNDIAVIQERAFSRASSKVSSDTGHSKHPKCNDLHTADCQIPMLTRNERHFTRGGLNIKNEIHDDIDSWNLDPEDLKQELHARKEREAGLEAALSDKEQVESELRRKLEEAKQREADLENDLASMWILVAKLRKEQEKPNDPSMIDGQDSPVKEIQSNSGNTSFRLNEMGMSIQKEVTKDDDSDKGHRSIDDLLDGQKWRAAALRTPVSRQKGRSRDIDLERDQYLRLSPDQAAEERNAHICKVCFEAPTAAVLLPCRHFCLCKPCAIACTECPLCRSGIADRIITFTS